MTTAHPSDRTSWPFGEYALAAVAFTDVVGFSLRVGEDEIRALRMLHRDFNLMRPIILRFHGHLLKTMGDGQLVCFHCANSAVHCAIAIQLALQEAARALPASDVLHHRIGIHLGDVLVSVDDVNGNGVNIASRLQGRAEPGGICISQTVYDVIKHQQAIRVTYLGAQDLRNIREAVHIYQILLGAAGDEPCPEPPPTAAPPAKVPVVASRAPAVRRSATTPFRIAVLGDFGGRSSRAVVEPWFGRPDRVVDMDNLDQQLARVELRLPGLRQSGEWVDLAFKSMEDFHPDRIARHSAPLRHLADLRRRLLVADAAAEAEIESMFRLLPAAAPASAGTAKSTGSAAVDTIVNRIFGPSGAGTSGRREEELLSCLDTEMTCHLRAILCHPDFQRMEAAWTALAALVNQFGDADGVSIHLVDLSKEELLADLLADGSPGAGLSDLLGRGPWAVLLGDYVFAPVSRELAGLEVLTGICAAAGVPFVAAADPLFAGCESFHGQPDPQDWKRSMTPDCLRRWEVLRRSQPAAFLGLAAPRFLLRQPYGPDNDPVELFPFSELPPDAWHEFLLWGNPAFLVGQVLGEAYLSEGWDFSAARSGVVEDRPLHRFTCGGEDGITPWAEAWLTQRAAETMLQRGLMPLLSDKGRNLIRLPALQSVASLSQPLAGPWAAHRH